LSTIRLNKLLATRGIGARRKCDALIESGAVSVNGEIVRTPGARVVEGRDRVAVNGRPLPERASHRYLVLHKPVGVISTMSDPEGRRTVRDLLPGGGRLFPVGRLDADTSGLLVVTNDGDLAHHLMHPRYGLEKFYRVLLEREPDDEQLRRLSEGVEFEPGIRSAPARVRRRDPVARGAVIEIALHEGRHRQVRRMCEAVGLDVLGLHRWAYGPLRLGELERGLWRELSAEEVERLRAASARVQPRGAARVGPRMGARAPYPARRGRGQGRSRGTFERGREEFGGPRRRSRRDAREGFERPRAGFGPRRSRRDFERPREQFGPRQSRGDLERPREGFGPRRSRGGFGRPREGFGPPGRRRERFERPGQSAFQRPGARRSARERFGPLPESGARAAFGPRRGGKYAPGFEPFGEQRAARPGRGSQPRRKGPDPRFGSRRPGPRPRPNAGRPRRGPPGGRRGGRRTG